MAIATGRFASLDSARSLGARSRFAVLLLLRGARRALLSVRVYARDAGRQMACANALAKRMGRMRVAREACACAACSNKRDARQ
eukprot:518346-Alexandrium_andersonii.AAC.1